MIMSLLNSARNVRKAVVTMVASGAIMLPDSAITAIKKTNTATTTMTVVELNDVSGRFAGGSFPGVASAINMDIPGSLESAPLCR